VRFVCVPVCDGLWECPGAQVCDEEQGLCREPDACGDDVDCQAGRVCDGGVCHAPCGEDAECAGAQTCELETGHCREPDVCGLDEDCVGLRVCGPDRACFVPECEDNGDCAAACVDRLCAAGPPRACRADDECEGAQVCAPLGACVLEEPCDDDDDCPGGAPACSPGGTCLACVDDGDCSLAEACEGDRCVYYAGCAEDADCPGDRTCEEENCVPQPGCEGDRFDRDPDPPPLVARTYTGLQLCDGTEDVYALEVPPDTGMRVVLRHPPAAGDLRLLVREAARRFVVLGDSDELLGVEVVTLPGSPLPRSLEVVVRGRRGFSPPYSLTLVEGLGEACPPDALEGLLGNDTPDRATRIAPGQHELGLCPADEDWLAVDVFAGSHVRVGVEHLGPPAGVGLSLHAPGGDVLEQVEGDGGLQVAADAATPGRHLVRVWSPDPEARLPLRVTLEVTAAADAEALACGHATPVDPGQPLLFPGWVPVTRFATSCGDPWAADYLARVELAEAALVTLRVVGGQALAIRSACADAAAEVVCEAGPDPILEGLPLEPGTWYVVVQPFAGGPPELRFTRQLHCDDDGGCDPGDVCDGGLCHPACELDEDCPGAQTCGPDPGHCREADPCQAPEDCAGLRECRHDGHCFLPECEVNDDCEGACVDRTCADAAPRACLGDEGCQPPRVCAPAGTCVLDRACEGHGECPEGSPWCVAAEGLCLSCLTDGDCAATEACGEGRCRYLGSCEADGDCPGDRQCDGNGDCVPAGQCVGDRFDAVPGAPRIVTRTYTGLVLCDGTTDAYSASVPAGEGLSVVLRHSPGVGDLVLTLEDPEPPLMELARSDATHGVEEVGVETAAEARELGVVVRGRPGDSVPYALTLERRGPGFCPPDGLEGPFGNDVAAHAAPIEVGRHAHVLCPGDEDWFSLHAGAGTALTATAFGTAPGVPVALTLLDPDRQVLVEGADDGIGVVAVGTLLQPGPHLLRVWSPQDELRQRVTLVVEAEAAADAEAMACAHSSPLAFDEPLAFPRTPAVNRFALSCGMAMPGLTTDHVARFELVDPATVALELRHADTVALRSACDDVQTETVCEMAADPDLQAVDLPRGTWYVIVQGVADDRPELLLTVP